MRDSIRVLSRQKEDIRRGGPEGDDSEILESLLSEEGAENLFRRRPGLVNEHFFLRGIFPSYQRVKVLNIGLYSLWSTGLDTSLDCLGSTWIRKIFKQDSSDLLSPGHVETVESVAPRYVDSLRHLSKRRISART